MVLLWWTRRFVSKKDSDSTATAKEAHAVPCDQTPLLHINVVGKHDRCKMEEINIDYITADIKCLYIYEGVN